MPAPPPRHLRARPRRLATPLRWLLVTALLVPLIAGLTTIGTQPVAEAAPGSPAAVASRAPSRNRARWHGGPGSSRGAGWRPPGGAGAVRQRGVVDAVGRP